MGKKTINPETSERVLLDENADLKKEIMKLSEELEQERQLKEKYQRLYEQEKAKKDDADFWKAQYVRMIGKYNAEQKGSTTGNERLFVEELQRKLSRKGTGKPRNNNTTDEDVLKLRNEGKTIREICSITELSTTTVIKILKGFKSDN